MTMRTMLKNPLPLLLVAILVIAGCGRDDQPRAIDPDAEPRTGGTLTIGIQTDGTSLDPHRVTDAASMRLIENMYSTLMRYAEQYGEFEPDLAQDYQVSEDSLVYTFELRPGVRFHDGRELTAEDVKYSIERIIEMQVRSEHFAAVDRIEVLDSLTVALHLTEPSAALLSYLAYPMNVIVNREVVEASDGSLDRVAAGSGPFQLVEWRQGQHLVLDRNPNYYIERRPHLDRVIFRPIPDPTARVTALRNREIDLILDVAEKDIPLVEGAGHAVVESVPGTFWEYIGLNNEHPPFDNPQVRQAIAWTIDREALNRLVKFGRSTPLTGGHIPEHHWAYAGLNIYPRPDLERARSLLAEAGYEQGFSTELKIGSDFAYQQTAAQVIKQQLEPLGIDVQILVLEPGIFFDALGRGEFAMTQVGWVGFVDPDEWMYNIFHSDGPYNQQNYANAEVDRLLEQGRATLDRDQRRQIYAEAQRLAAEDAPLVFLYINHLTSAYLNDVHGYVVHPTASTIWLRETWLAR